MRTRIAWMLLALAVGLAGCGGAAEGPPTEAAVSTPTAGTTTAKQRTGSKPAAKRTCAEQGIGDPGRKEGACIQGGMRVVVANGRSQLRLRQLQASIHGISVREQLPGSGHATLSPQGIYIVITLTITNHDKVAHRFGGGQTVLGISNEQYEDRGEIERVYPRALANPARGAIPPGGVARGDVVFDVPVSEVSLVTREGRLFVGNFGGLPAREVGATRELGELRLYT